MTDPVARAALLALALAVAAMGGAPARGQSPEANPDAKYTDLSQYLLPASKSPSALGAAGAQNAPAGGGNVSVIDQTGFNNRAVVDLTGAANATRQIQLGAGNSSSVSITGADNNVATTQGGNNDATTISLTGQANNVQTTQIGNNLSYSLQQIGNGKTVTVQQYGAK
jgi:minor curlin subunit